MLMFVCGVLNSDEGVSGQPPGIFHQAAGAMW